MKYFAFLLSLIFFSSCVAPRPKNIEERLQDLRHTHSKNQVQIIRTKSKIDSSNLPENVKNEFKASIDRYAQCFRILVKETFQEADQTKGQFLLNAPTQKEFLARLERAPATANKIKINYNQRMKQGLIVIRSEITKMRKFSHYPEIKSYIVSLQDTEQKVGPMISKLNLHCDARSKSSIAARKYLLANREQWVYIEGKLIFYKPTDEKAFNTSLQNTSQ